MTDYAIKKMLLLRKRLYALWKDSEDTTHSILPEDYAEFGETLEQVIIMARNAYWRVADSCEGLMWPSERIRRETKKRGNGK